MEQSKQAKYCLNLPNKAQMLCFNKLTGEYNAKKYFVLWEYIFKLKYQIIDAVYNNRYTPGTSLLKLPEVLQKFYIKIVPNQQQHAK